MKEFLIETLCNILGLALVVVVGLLLIGLFTITCNLVLNAPLIGVPLAIVEAAILMSLLGDH